MKVYLSDLVFKLNPRALGMADETKCPAPGCIAYMWEGSLVLSTPLGITHPGCVPWEIRERESGCPFCSEQHHQPFDGTCLL